MEEMNERILFMGSPDFALATLNALAGAFNVVGVVTQPDRPAGRGRLLKPPPVKLLAEKLGLPILQPTTLKDPEAVNQLEIMKPDLIVVAAFGQILRKDVLQLPPLGCLNVHASLLPRWRGAAPIQAAVLHDEFTGVTIMKMDPGLDTGPILSQQTTPIPPDMTAGELFHILAQMGADLLVETLPKYILGEIQPQPQDDGNATYAPRLKKEDGRLDFSKSAAFLARQVRAYHPWPGTFQFLDDLYIKVFQAHAVDQADVVPGKRYVMDNLPAWGTAQGLLILDKVQPAGKKPMSGEAFLNGTRHWIDN